VKKALLLILAAVTMLALVQPAWAQVNRSQTITLNFVGDILLASRIQELIDAEGPLAPWLGVKDLLQSADFTIGNLECAVGTTGFPMPDKQWTFRASPETLQGLRDAGVDAVSLANNHTLDFGAECLLETIEHVKNCGIIPIGAGPDEASAREPVILEKNGIRIALFATSMVIPVWEWAAEGDRPGLAVDYSMWNHNIVARIEAIRPDVDYIVVYLHWGEERTTEPEDWVLRMENVLREAGADIIIGSHPHVLRGLRFDGKSLTAFSLGNFIFATRLDSPACQIGAVLSITLSKRAIEEVVIHPTEIVWGKTFVMEGQAKQEVLATLGQLSQPFDTDVIASGQVLERVFPDVLNHWARVNVSELARLEIVRGFEDGRFLPDKPVTRAEFATTLARVISGKLELANTDVPMFQPDEFSLCEPDHWAYPYLAYLAGLSILPAHDPEWLPDEFCPRAEVCALLWKTVMRDNAANNTGENGSNGGAGDNPHEGGTITTGITDQVWSQFQNELEPLDPERQIAVLWCINESLLKGYDDGTLRLDNPVTRAEAATIILRFMNLQSRGS
jgi:poly-gamma-glutamate synthesis protein (capsule biosynthesis protein)